MARPNGNVVHVEARASRVADGIEDELVIASRRLENALFDGDLT